MTVGMYRRRALRFARYLKRVEGRDERYPLVSYVSQHWSGGGENGRYVLVKSHSIEAITVIGPSKRQQLAVSKE